MFNRPHAADGPDNLAQIVLALAGLFALIAVGMFLIGKLRGRYRQSDLSSGNLLDNFRELHTRGELSDEEYRNIKSKLAVRLREEWAAKPKPSTRKVDAKASNDWSADEDIEAG